MRDGNTGIAMNGHLPALVRQMNSELESSETSNSSPPTMRSKIARGDSIGM